MGFFSKKKRTTEKNEINNQKLKENLADAAMNALKSGEDYDQLAHTTCKFGYLFMIDGHGLEALFKLTTDKGVFYFAAQGDRLIRLQFNEDLFKSTTETFLELHQ